MTTKQTSRTLRFQHGLLQDFIQRVLVRLHVPEPDAQIAAVALIAADLMGIDTHGIASLAIRSRLYTEALQSGRMKSEPCPTVVYDSPSLALIDGDGGMGLVVAAMAQDLAIRKAADTGVGAVAVRNSNHIGAAGVWALKAAQAGMIGIVFQNGGRLVVPAGGRERLLGTNPIAIAVPSQPHPFLMDFATSVVAMGKLQLAEIQGRDIPEGWVVDDQGKPSRDPAVVRKGGALLPLGSNPELSWHKGFALSMVVEILSGILSGGSSSLDRPPDNFEHCHFHLVLKVESFRPLSDFISHMARFQDGVRSSASIDPSRPVVSPGDFEFAHREDRMKNGIPLHEVLIANLQKLSAELDVPFPDPLP